MANKPTKAEYEGFKKAVANPMTPAPIKQKLQSIIDQYSSEYEGGSEAPKAEPKSRAGRKPSTTKKYKTLPKTKVVALITSTKQAVEDMKAQLKKLGYNPEEVDALNGNQAFAILEELKSKMVGKPKRTATPRATKKTATDIEKAKAQIKAKTGKTEEECEAIIEQYRALRTKAQEGKRKAEQATATNKKRVAKLEDKGDLIEGTNVKTADAVIETTAQDVAEKIEQQIEAVEEKAEKEAVAEVAKDNTKKTPTQKKQAVEAKVEKKVKEKTKVIVKKVVIDTTALLTSIATSLGKFDKDSQKEFLIKLRSDIDKLLAKYAFGGMTDGAVQVMNVQQSNLSSSSVNPTMFAKGGGVFSKGRVVLADGKGVGGNKNKTYQLIKFDYTDGSGDEGFEIREMPSNKVMSQGTNYGEVLQYFNLYIGKFAKGGGVDGGAKIRIDSVDIDVYEDSYEEGEGRYVNGYSRNDLVGKLVSPKELVKFLSDELDIENYRYNYSILDGAIFTSKLVDEDSNTASERQKAEWKKGDLTLYSENTRIGVSIIHPTEITDEELSELTGIGLYEKGGKVKMSSKFAKGGRIYALVDKFDANKQVYDQVYYKTNNYNEIIGYIADLKNEGEYDSDMQLIEVSSNGRMRKFDSSMLETGGVVGQEIVFDYNGEENTGVIKEITNLGDYVVRADNGRTLLAQRDMDVISLGAMRQQGVEQRKKRFGFFKKGGIVGSSAKLKSIDEAYASYGLQDELREKLGIDENRYSLGDNVVISFAYTDYGGDFLDKVAIEYFKENYPENTLVEYAGYGGENAFVFGEPAQEWIDSTEDYLLGFEDFESFYYEKVNEAEYESFAYFLDDLERDDYTFDREEVLDWLMENRGGYYSMDTQGLDFSYSDLTDELLEEGLISKEDEDDDEEYARGGGIKDVIVYDNNRETFDRYTIFTPDGSVYGMSDNPLMPNGFNMYIGDNTEIQKGSHLGKKLKSVPETIKIAVERRMSEEYAKGGLTEHGLKLGDKIIGASGSEGEILNVYNRGKQRRVNIQTGERSTFGYAKGGKLWIDTKGKGGLKGVKPSRKNTFRNEAVKRNMTSGQLATKVLASPSRYKGINPRSAQLVKNMGVRKQGGSIGDILRNRRGE